MSVQDIYNQIADRFERLDRKYWVIGLCLLVGLLVIQPVWYPIMVQTGGWGGVAGQLLTLLSSLMWKPVSLSLLVLVLHGVSSFWLSEIGTRFRRRLVVVALLLPAVMLVSWFADYAFNPGEPSWIFAGLLADFLTLFALAWPTIVKLQLLSSQRSGRPSVALWWEMSALGLLVLPGLVQFLSTSILVATGMNFSSRVHGSEVHAVLGTAVLASWYFWFDRMWCVRFNRVLATLHLGAALVGPLTLAIYAIGLNLLTVWHQLQTEGGWTMPTSGDGLDYTAVQAMIEHVEVFEWIAIALFFIVFLEAMVRKMMGGTVQTYDAATARRLRRYAALVLLAGVLFMGLNSLVYLLLSL